MSVIEIVSSVSEAAPFDPTVGITVAATVALTAIVAVFVLLAFAPYLPPEWEERIAGSSVDRSQGGSSQNAD